MYQVYIFQLESVRFSCGRQVGGGAKGERRQVKRGTCQKKSRARVSTDIACRQA